MRDGWRRTCGGGWGKIGGNRHGLINLRQRDREGQLRAMLAGVSHSVR